MTYIERMSLHAQSPLALVVGCGGMGLSIARALGKRHPLLIVDIDAGRLDASIDALEREGYVVAGHACDIVDPVQTQALADALAKGLGVKALAHVAAVGMSIGDWRRMMEVDLIGAQRIADAVGPHMVRGGAAVFISSLASYLPPADARLEALLEITAVVDFVLSDAATFLNGIDIPVDGGHRAVWRRDGVIQR